MAGIKLEQAPLFIWTRKHFIQAEVTETYFIYAPQCHLFFQIKIVVEDGIHTMLFTRNYETDSGHQNFPPSKFRVFGSDFVPKLNRRLLIVLLAPQNVVGAQTYMVWATASFSLLLLLINYQQRCYNWTVLGFHPSLPKTAINITEVTIFEGISGNLGHSAFPTGYHAICILVTYTDANSISCFYPWRK